MSQAAVWYFRYQSIYVDVDEARVAIGGVLSLSDDGECSPVGVQYPDGTWNEWHRDPIVREVTAERAARWDAEYERMKVMKPPPTRKIKAPWVRNRNGREERPEVTVPVDTPGWVGWRK